MINEEDLKTHALANAEQNGIVFIDEIDKIASRSEMSGADVSRQGVQRDLLPLVEGTTVTTKYGMVKTDHILFIASGAFHLAKPSDLIPELQGRLPIRVELDSLSAADFENILTQTDACLTRQYQALLETEGVTLRFAARGHQTPRRDRFRGQRENREHRRAAPVYRDGKAAGGNFFRRRQAQRRDSHHRCRLCRCATQRAGPIRRPGAVRVMRSRFKFAETAPRIGEHEGAIPS